MKLTYCNYVVEISLSIISFNIATADLVVQAYFTVFSCLLIETLSSGDFLGM